VVEDSVFNNSKDSLLVTGSNDVVCKRCVLN